MERSAAARRAAVALVAVSMGWASAPAWGSTASAERQGAALTKAVNTGERSCRSLSAAELDRIGEYAMGLGFTTGAQHDAMNARMRTMIGAAGERQAHRAMGGSYSGCAANAAQDGTSGTVMMGRYGASPTMMNGSDYGPGMARSTPADDGGLGTVPGVLIALAAAVLGAGLVAFALRRLPLRRSG